MGDIFDRHENVALALSGGKDSLACLYLFKPYWDRLTVYWLNPGDTFPETVDFMHGIRKMVPNFVELHGDVKRIIKLDGWPSDVVPHNYTSDGNVIFGATPFKVQTREQCCIRSLMMPAYRQMLADGVTCCIRGKRHDEADKTGLLNGHVSPEGMELVFPIYDWTSQDVRDYLRSISVPLPNFYKHGDHSVDCMHCTAYWEDGHAKYLRAEHPVAFIEYERRVQLIKRAVVEQLSKCEV